MPEAALLDWAREAVRSLGTQKDAAEKADIPYATLQRVLNGSSPLTLERLEKIAKAVGVDAREILADPERARLSSLRPSTEGLALVPLHDVHVSAGHGIDAVEAGSSPESLGFPKAWLRQTFGDEKRLRIVKVRGDSMAPTLHDGDLTMIDLDRRDQVDGIFVLRMEDQLLVKRVLFPSSRRILVTSDNRDYDRWDRMLDLESEAARDGFQIIGRVVWVGRSI